MRKIVIIVVLFAAQLHLIGQKKLLADFISSDSIAIAGVFEGYEKNPYEFYVTDPVVVKKLIENLEYGKQTYDRDRSPGIWLCVIKNRQLLEQWYVHVSSSQIEIAEKSKGGLRFGNNFRFDTLQLKDVATKFPMHITKHNLQLTNYAEYKEVENYLMKDKSVIFVDMPHLTEQVSVNPTGIFYLDFPNNSKFSSPSAVSTYLQSRMEKICTKDKFLVMYEINDFNMTNNGKYYRMTVSCDKRMFDEFNDKNAVKSEWIPAPVSVTYYQSEH